MIEEKYHEKKTMRAEFQQVKHVASLRMEKKSEGHIWANRFGKIRWETTTPEPSLFVSNGVTFWYYIPPLDSDDTASLIEDSASKIKTKFVEQLIQGQLFQSTKTTKVSKIGPLTYQIKPKKSTAGDIEEARVRLEKGLIKEIELKYFNKNKTVITLKSIVLGEPESADLYEFKKPEKYRKIEIKMNGLAIN